MGLEFFEKSVSKCRCKINVVYTRSLVCGAIIQLMPHCTVRVQDLRSVESKNACAFDDECNLASYIVTQIVLKEASVGDLL